MTQLGYVYLAYGVAGGAFSVLALALFIQSRRLLRGYPIGVDPSSKVCLTVQSKISTSSDRLGIAQKLTDPPNS
jgi:hypothetical protein